jgi:outer membrane murein-binding lipoprotein Lpp
MRDSNRKIIVLQWIVIAVLALGAAAGAFLLLTHADNVDTTNSQLNGDVDSLHRQVDQLKAQLAATPTPTPTPLATPAPSPTPTPKR